jgi:hypothetical protein
MAVGIGKDRVQQCSNVANGLWCQLPPIRLGLSASTTVILQAVDRFLDSGGRHLVEPHVPKFTDQVSSELPVPFQRLWCAPAARVFFYQ